MARHSVPTACTAMSDPIGSPVVLTPTGGDSSTATSEFLTSLAVGYWCFASYYSGDANCDASSDGSVDECVNVEGQVTIVTASVHSETKEKFYSAPLVARGGTMPYTWTRTGPPRGLYLDPLDRCVDGNSQKEWFLHVYR